MNRSQFPTRVVSQEENPFQSDSNRLKANHYTTKVIGMIYDDDKNVGVGKASCGELGGGGISIQDLICGCAVVSVRFR